MVTVWTETLDVNELVFIINTEVDVIFSCMYSVRQGFMQDFLLGIEGKKRSRKVTHANT